VRAEEESPVFVESMENGQIYDNSEAFSRCQFFPFGTARAAKRNLLRTLSRVDPEERQ
jgi:hypothetical protein